MPVKSRVGVSLGQGGFFEGDAIGRPSRESPILSDKAVVIESVAEVSHFLRRVGYFGITRDHHAPDAQGIRQRTKAGSICFAKTNQLKAAGVKTQTSDHRAGGR